MTTIEEVDKYLEELRLAMLENIEASKEEVNAKLRKQKAHYRLVQAKEQLRNIEFDNYQITGK